MDTTATAALAQTLSETASTQSLSILDLATKGGWIMIVLLVLSLLAVYIFVSKFIQLRKAGEEDKYFVQRIKDYVVEGKTSSAIKLCEDTDTPYARMIHKGLLRIGRPMSDILVIVENVGNVEVGRLEKGLPILATVAAGAPCSSSPRSLQYGMAIEPRMDRASTCSCGLCLFTRPKAIYRRPQSRA